MLDEKGISLDEIKNKYPESFQSLGYDVLFDVDSSNKPKVISTFQLCINSILTLLFAKPGNFPSIPELGIDVEQYLLDYADNSRIPAEIKNKLVDQCNKLQIIGIDIEVFVDIDQSGNNVLVLKITGTDKLTYGSDNNRVFIGITYDNLNRIYMKQSYV